jgi:hypothetical protein
MDLPKLHIEDKRSNQQNQREIYSYALADLRWNALACCLTTNSLRLSLTEGVCFQSPLDTDAVPLSSRLAHFSNVPLPVLSFVTICFQKFLAPNHEAQPVRKQPGRTSKEKSINIPDS